MAPPSGPTLTMATDLNPLITAYSHLHTFPRADEALRTLKRVVSLAQPLMRARGWRVGLLSEMYPERENLLGLNLNQGETILLRLRPADDPGAFLPFSKVVDAMLHELAHIVYLDHDDRFNALWDQLREELDALTAKGFTGEPFLGRGRRLGGRNVPHHELLRLARIEAQRRRPAAAAGTGGVHRLGGGPPPRPGRDLRDAILESIERRRAWSERGCANNHYRSERDRAALSQAWTRSGFRSRPDEDAADEAAFAQALWELVQEDERRRYGDSYLPPSAQNPFGSRCRSSRRHRRRGSIDEYSGSRADSPPPLRRNPRARPPPRSPERRDFWACDLCTLHNPLRATECGACGSARPAQASRNR